MYMCVWGRVNEICRRVAGQWSSGYFFSWQGGYMNFGVDKVVLVAFRRSGRRMKGGYREYR